MRRKLLLEVNLSPKGEGDIAPGALRKLDLVLGCFHSALRRVDDQTGRYIAALNNPEIHEITVIHRLGNNDRHQAIFISDLFGIARL
jgi:histidinol phosphatase-like PHP family hydrolase